MGQCTVYQAGTTAVQYGGPVPGLPAPTPPNDTMLASVIVPFLNEEEFLPRCVESLLGQDVGASDYELIFVDNGSTDRSADLLAGVDRVTLLTQPSGNVYAARNRGLAAASGEIVVFTDADCEMSPGWL